MLFDRRRPHVFRERRVTPGEAEVISRAEVAAAEQRAARGGPEAFAVHLAHDRTRVVTVEAWRSADDCRHAPDTPDGSVAVYEWAATGGLEPTPVADDSAGVIIVDLFRVWRPLIRPVAAFNIRNGEAFNRQPGCISTTVLRSSATGGIATYARWRSVGDFAAAFSALTGRKARTADDVNRAAASMTLGLIRPDYHSYELVAVSGDAP